MFLPPPRRLTSTDDYPFLWFPFFRPKVPGTTGRVQLRKRKLEDDSSAIPSLNTYTLGGGGGSVSGKGGKRKNRAVTVDSES